MATTATATKKPKIEEMEDVEANMLSAQIPDDKEALLEFMDKRANSIQYLKDQISKFERKLAEERKVMADAESKFLRIDRVENDTFSNTKTKVSGKSGSLFGISEFWTEGNCGKTVNENSTPRPCDDAMIKSKKPCIMLPPAFKRRACAAINDANVIPETKKSRVIFEEVVQKTQARDNQTQTQVRDNHQTQTQVRDNQTQTQVRDTQTQSQGRDNHQTQAQVRDNQTQSQVRENQTQAQTQAQDNQTQTQVRDSQTKKVFAKPRMTVSSNIPRQGQQQKAEFQGHDELIALIGRSSLRATMEARTVGMLPSCHTKRVRSLALSPSTRDLFATSALDGAVHFWQLQSDRSTATLYKTVNRGADQKKWPEDIAWHPHKSSLFSVYAGDDGHPQISVLHLNKAQASCEFKFLKDRPHTRGLINRITFTPWDDPCFVTGGSDHGVVLWREQCENTWKPTLLHRDLHTSAVMGVAGLRHNNLILSCGDDRRFVGYDVQEEKVKFKHRLDNRCTNLLPNPRDVNLVMVHTRQLDRQLRLYDIRLPQTELLSFGWKQQSSEMQSALINQSWSPDGLHLSTGSADPMIHIFDIRYNAKTPSFSIKAHKKRVFKAEWHSSFPLLVSISSDLAIGIHNLS